MDPIAYCINESQSPSTEKVLFTKIDAPFFVCGVNYFEYAKFSSKQT